MQVTLVHTENIAKNIKTFWLEPEHHVDYVAGQFIEMYLPHENPDERGQKHWFTLSSSPTEELLAITTKHDTGLSSTFKQTLFNLPVGSEITIIEPMGDFVLPKDKAIPLVYVVAGMGVTPVRSMVKWLADNNEQRDIHIIYGVRSLEELAFRELFEGYGAKFEIMVSEPSADWTGLAGHMTAEHVLRLTKQLREPTFFVSGPEIMVENIEADMLASGVDKHRLVLDFFPGYRAF